MGIWSFLTRGRRIEKEDPKVVEERIAARKARDEIERRRVKQVELEAKNELEALITSCGFKIEEGFLYGNVNYSDLFITDGFKAVQREIESNKINRRQYSLEGFISEKSLGPHTVIFGRKSDEYERDYMRYKERRDKVVQENPGYYVINFDFPLDWENLKDVCLPLGSRLNDREILVVGPDKPGWPEKQPWFKKLQERLIDFKLDNLLSHGVEVTCPRCNGSGRYEEFQFDYNINWERYVTVDCGCGGTQVDMVKPTEEEKKRYLEQNPMPIDLLRISYKHGLSKNTIEDILKSRGINEPTLKNVFFNVRVKRASDS